MRHQTKTELAETLINPIEYECFERGPARAAHVIAVLLRPARGAPRARSATRASFGNRFTWRGPAAADAYALRRHGARAECALI